MDIRGFPMGAQGKWPTCNNNVLTEMGLTVGRRMYELKLMNWRVLFYSLDILRNFLRKSAEPGSPTDELAVS